MFIKNIEFSAKYMTFIIDTVHRVYEREPSSWKAGRKVRPAVARHPNSVRHTACASGSAARSHTQLWHRDCPTLQYRASPVCNGLLSTELKLDGL